MSAAPLDAEPQAGRPALPAAVWAGLALLCEAGYLVWALPVARPLGYGARLALYLVLFLPVAAAAYLARRRPAAGAELRWALAFAAIFRLTLLPAAPLLSDDAYRYARDGRVQAHGVNPYLHAPDAPDLASLREPWHARINHPDVSTIYPPLSQILFGAAALISDTVLGVKALLVAVELLSWLALVRIWRLRSLPLSGLVLYLWSPLVVLEGSGSGHNDALGVGLLLCASLLIILGRPGVSILAWSASVGAKLFPLLTLPLWLRAAPRRFWVLPPLVWALLWAPYLGAGTRLWTGLAAYGRHWESNVFLFRYLREGIAWLDPKPWLDREWARACGWAGSPELAAWIWPWTEPRQIAKLLIAAGLGAAIAAWARRRADPPWATFRILGLALMWAPTLHPWYLLWLLPFACWFGAYSWLVLSATVFLSYAPSGWAGLSEETLLWIEYAPFLAVWVAEEAHRRRPEALPSAAAREGG